MKSLTLEKMENVHVDSDCIADGFLLRMALLGGAILAASIIADIVAVVAAWGWGTFAANYIGAGIAGIGIGVGAGMLEGCLNKN